MRSSEPHASHRGASSVLSASGSAVASMSTAASGGRSSASMDRAYGAATLQVMAPETVAAIARLEASGLIAEALAAFRVDHVYAVEIANAHAQALRRDESARKANGARAARRATLTAS